MKNLVSTSMVLPEQISLPYHQMFGKSDNDTSPVLLQVEDVKQENRARHEEEIEKSVKDGEFAGLLHVRILEGKKLQLDNMGAHSSPYCILSTGPHEVFTTKAVKRSKNPVWNEFFELLVKKQREKKLEVTVMARDTVNGDDFLGILALPFDENTRDTKDVWVAIERHSRAKGTQFAGEIHLQVRYVTAPSQVLDREKSDKKDVQ